MLKNKANLTFEKEWPLLEPTILKLLKQEGVSHREWQDLFWSIHSICLWDDLGPIKVFTALENDILGYVEDTQYRICSDVTHSSLLRKYIMEWTKFLDQCSYLPKPFAQLETIIKSDRKFQTNNHYNTFFQNFMESGSSNKQHTRVNIRNEEERLIRKLMLDVWNRSIFQSVKPVLQQNALDLIRSERSGEAFDSQLVIGVRESFVNLCSDVDDPLRIYRENFEQPYIGLLSQHYTKETRDFLEENGIENYLKYVNAKIVEEEQRARRYLETKNGSKSMSLVMETCVAVMIDSYRDRILTELPRLIKTNDLPNLNHMYKLIAKTKSGVEPMLNHIESHILQDGLDDMLASANEITTDPEKYVDKLLTLYNRYSELIKRAFDNDPRFLTSRDKAFKQVLNDTRVFQLDLVEHPKEAFPSSTSNCHQNSTLNRHHESNGIVPTGAGRVLTNGTPYPGLSKNMSCPPESKCPQLLANYCDMLLRKSVLSKKLTGEEIEQKLKLVLQLLKYVQNKDVFMRYHRFNLGRRLIFDNSMDSEKEENMVEWLRSVGMPTDYINKLSRMFQDVKVSKDFNEMWKGAMKSQNKDSIASDKISVKILNAGAWAKPSYRVPVTLPMELEDSLPEVEEFYKTKHSGRKLKWYHALSYGIISFKTASGSLVDLEVSTLQLALLFVWNTRARGEILSFEDLKLATELPENELRRTLWSLVAFPKLKSQLLLVIPPKAPLPQIAVKSSKDFNSSTSFAINQNLVVTKNNKVCNRGKINLIGRSHLLTSDPNVGEENQAILQLRVYRIQEAIIKIMKTRRKITNAQLHTELIELLKNMFLPARKMVKEQIEWLIERKYMERDPLDINSFVYLA